MPGPALDRRNQELVFVHLLQPALNAELRAAVFLALEEQEKVENKTPLVNESLRKFLNTKDGRLAASLVAEFLQFFNLDFTLAVFQPETSTFQCLEGRENLARDLGIIEAEGTVGGPLLLEVIRRCQQKERGPPNGEGALELSDVHSPPKSPEGKTSAHSNPSKDEGDVEGRLQGIEVMPFRRGTLPRPSAASTSRCLLRRAGCVAGFVERVGTNVTCLFLNSAGTGEDDYADDFNSTSHRSEKSDLSVGEEIEEDLSVEIDDLNTSDKLDDLTQDLTVSQLSDVADYLEDVA
ncbi:centrosomal protein 43 [Mustela nigripes]|uniref:centrosomal protein 43 n=1 Tax=Mustela nigripes TaxID=77151 RepID=UPI0028157A58|nr:centrosomal protein 43 [Mustela nigripes]